MKALLLAAGRATRLGLLSDSTPKCLQEVGDETILDRLVRQLTDAGVDEFLINTHHLADQVNDHVAQSSWVDRATTVHEPELLGTLGTLRANVGFFTGAPGWVLHADNFIAGSLSGVVEAFSRRELLGAWGSLLTFEADDPTSCGVVESDGSGVVTGFHEKVVEPPGSTASAATFLFDTPVFDLAVSLPRSSSDIGRDLIPLLVGRLIAVSAEGCVIDIGTPEGLTAARFEAAVLSRRA